MTPRDSTSKTDLRCADALSRQFVADVIAAMERDRIDRKELGRRWGKSRQQVHEVLNCQHNLGMVTLAGLASALGRRVSVRLELKKISDKE